MHTPTLTIVPLSAETKDDFYRIHGTASGHDYCYCMAWWSPDWESWSDRTAEENRTQREELMTTGQYDGYLLYGDNKPIGWVQVCNRDRFTKLTKQFRRKPDRHCAAITCWYLVAEFRNRGLTLPFLKLLLADLQQSGFESVEAFPVKWEDRVNQDDLWTGPLSIYEKAGFKLERDHEMYPVYRKVLLTASEAQ